MQVINSWIDNHFWKIFLQINPDSQYFRHSDNLGIKNMIVNIFVKSCKKLFAGMKVGGKRKLTIPASMA